MVTALDDTVTCEFRLEIETGVPVAGVRTIFPLPLCIFSLKVSTTLVAGSTPVAPWEFTIGWRFRLGLGVTAGGEAAPCEGLNLTLILTLTLTLIGWEAAPCEGLKLVRESVGLIFSITQHRLWSPEPGVDTSHGKLSHVSFEWGSG